MYNQLYNHAAVQWNHSLRDIQYKIQVLSLQHSIPQYNPWADSGYEHNPLMFSCFSQMDTSNKSEPVHIIGLGQQDVPSNGPLCQKRRVGNIVQTST